jgi:hypothetical protein
MFPLCSRFPAFTIAVLLIASLHANAATTIDGELKRWHPIALTFDGPEASEDGDINPFLDYRLNVIFTHADSGSTVVVPGYFAADGDAANTSADSGNKWRVHFVARETGQWIYEISFRSGAGIATHLDSNAGAAVKPDGDIGSFSIAETDKTGRDHRGKGILSYVGERHPRFDNGEYFLKAGADAPETLLAYADFDNTYDHGGGNSIKSYEAHVRDWNPGDPVWQDKKGTGLIGAVNYLAGKGMNAFSFLTMNVTGDGKNVWPWTAHVERYRFDVSKLAQWEIVFSHADASGMFLHFKTQETENDLLLDGGTLGPQRKLYYRELIARFAHHLALNWNLGEENDTWEELDDPQETNIKLFIDYISGLDPYDHPIVIHSYPDQQTEVYTPLLGAASGLDGVSLQSDIENVHTDTTRWIHESGAAGKQWMVANDEIGPANVGVKPDGEDNNHFDTRHLSLWGNLMAGGWGVEYYFGYLYPHSDLHAEDWASRDISWDQARFALHFFNTYLPFTEMKGANQLTRNEADYVYAKESEVYAIYLPQADETSIDLGADEHDYSVSWYNPRRGGALQQGSVIEVQGPGTAGIGRPPAEPDLDWVVLIKRL